MSPSPPLAAPYSDGKVANRDFRDFGWEIAHGADTRRPPISLYPVVLRTGGYTYAAKVWDLSIMQGPFSVAVPNVTIHELVHRCTGDLTPAYGCTASQCEARVLRLGRELLVHSTASFADVAAVAIAAQKERSKRL
jgi:hypothetical protein